METKTPGSQDQAFFILNKDLLHSLDHILNHFLCIIEDHHSFIRVKEFVNKNSKNRDLEQHKKEQEKLNLRS